MTDSNAKALKRISQRVRGQLETILSTRFVTTVIKPEDRRHDRPIETLNRSGRTTMFCFRSKEKEKRPRVQDLGHEWSASVYLYDARLYVEIYNLTVQEERLLVRALKQMANHGTRIYNVNVIRIHGPERDIHHGKHHIIPRKPKE